MFPVPESVLLKLYIHNCMFSKLHNEEQSMLNLQTALIHDKLH